MHDPEITSARQYTHEYHLLILGLCFGAHAGKCYLRGHAMSCVPEWPSRVSFASASAAARVCIPRRSLESWRAASADLLDNTCNPHKAKSLRWGNGELRPGDKQRICMAQTNVLQTSARARERVRSSARARSPSAAQFRI